MSNISEIEIKNIDHLGIVAGIIDSIGLVEIINEYCGKESGEKISSGHVVKAMILNGLGFVSSPLYMFSEFFKDKPCEHLIGEGVKAEYLNDYKLGRVMDKLFIKGLTEIFLAISMNVKEKFDISSKSSHLDSSSLHVHGEYNNSLPDIILDINPENTIKPPQARRDQFGILPFYYAQVNNTLICSNTLNCIRLHPQISTDLNQQAVGDFLTRGMNMEWDTTIFNDIKRLPPAHTLTWQAEELNIQRYWQLPRVQPLIFYKKPQEYVEHFSELFEQAVSDRLRTNRIATHLSGGMDSTSIAATANKVLLERGKPFNFQAFTMRDRLMMPEEDSFASMVAHYIGIPLSEINAEGKVSNAPSAKLQTPLPEPNGIPGRNGGSDLTQRCADHARVVLTGFGGDPGLRFGEFDFFVWWKHGLRREIFQVLGHHLRTHRPTKLYLRQGRAYWRKITKQKVEFPTWFNADFVKQQNLQQRDEQINAECIDYVARYGMANTPFWSNIFEKADPGSTGIPIKPYYPFFDLRLVNFMVSIPPIPWLVNKNILRYSMKGKLPEAVRTRPKIVFKAPEEYVRGMRESVGLWAGDLLRNTPGLEEYVNIGELLECLESEEIDTQKLMGLEKTLTVAYWLRSLQEDTRFDGVDKVDRVLCGVG